MSLQNSCAETLIPSTVVFWGGGDRFRCTHGSGGALLLHEGEEAPRTGHVSAGRGWRLQSRKQGSWSWILDFSLQAVRSKDLLYKPPRLWCLAVAAQADYTGPWDPLPQGGQREDSGAACFLI